MNKNLLRNYEIIDKNSLSTLLDSFDYQERMLVNAIHVEKDFIQNLVNFRKKQNITQKEIAEKTGLTQQAISGIETGGRKPTLINLIRYLQGIGININDLFIENRTNLKLEQIGYIDELYYLFLEKFNYVTEVLKDNNIKDSEWDIDFIKKDALKSVKTIKDKIIINKSINLQSIRDLLEKSKNNFKIVDNMYDNPIKRSEQYYDLLIGLFDNAKEIINFSKKSYPNQ
ncbi:TPA: helix-turn-helix transcriptional regulator [Clostridioides difficile]|uniref:helix-turn-helix domain-containing protein n=1 Tax=Clostridioides difficile TaxID=1496 RepID=UPI00016C5FB1|nr:helix-turn-helix transcriptional regulator [Clostridioides difficile]EGT3944779.1 XRE family transcriptional regulator [Clostridioides difficile]MBG0197896.1 helix-turn-helix transcriptional regulator [Clostridioides difficile]MCA0574421.1 helix-turn-helix transcriptional regulator [Clostridioides difficile]PBG23759.1 hypothetical protein BGU81_18745 [Clostridioides difficile]SJT15140.1 DNA-binding transcriptional repressor PuuR [Clostridioides difficile]